uniref:Uncharacterized protein n=1 Tax=Bubo bubo TaxID=30461 RepID=A0A8C0E773_BUBBB
MPFAYFFTESEGFAGSKKVGGHLGVCPPLCPPLFPGSPLTPLPQGIMARVYETSVVLLLLTLLVLGLCTFTLAVALGAVLLLPFSIISNEVLLSFPHNYYIQWLNGSLVHGLWNLIFLFSNLSLVFLMPFAYFFTESEGFAGSKKGIMARVYETSVVLLLLTLLVLGMVWVA